MRVEKLNKRDNLWIHSLVNKVGLEVIVAHESLGDSSLVIASAPMLKNLKVSDNPNAGHFRVLGMGQVYTDVFPVTYRGNMYQQNSSMEVVINLSLSKLNREQRAVAILYAVANAYSYNKEGNISFKVNLKGGSTLANEVMEFLADLTGTQQSMSMDLLRATLNH